MKTLETVLGRGFPATGSERRYLCPFCVTRGHTEDTKGHLYVNETKGVFYCQRCACKGLISYLHELFGIEEEKIFVPSEDTLEELRKALEHKISVEEDLSYQCEVEPVVPGMRGYAYLFGARGYSDWVIREHAIVEGVHPQFGRRIFIPTKHRGKLLYWVGRTIEGKNPKYINPPVPKTCVFNLSNVPPSRPLVICEGVFSAISCHPWAVALFGKVATPAQLLALREFNPPMYLIALDGDAGDEAEKLAESLASTGKPIRIVDMPEEEDPDSLPPGAFWKLPVRAYSATSTLEKLVACL